MELFQDTSETFLCHMASAKVFSLILFITYPHRKRHPNTNWNKLVCGSSKNMYFEWV